MFKKYIHTTKMLLLTTLAVNIISLQKLLLLKNKKKNKKGFLYKMSLQLSKISNFCLNIVLKNSQNYIDELYKKNFKF